MTGGWFTVHFAAWVCACVVMLESASRAAVMSQLERRRRPVEELSLEWWER